MSLKRIKGITDSLKVKNLSPVKDYLSTGCTILDLAIADRLPGGFGGGRISHIYGLESSAKSMIVAEVLASVQRQGGTAELDDSEGSFDFSRAESLHDLNISKLQYLSGKDNDELTIETLFDERIQGEIDSRIRKADKWLAEKKKKNPKGRHVYNYIPSVIGIDSLSAIPSFIEISEAMGEKSYGMTRAKSLSKGFRKCIWKLSKCNLALLFVDQTRQNVGVKFGKKYTFAGGEALKFYASTRIFLKTKEKLENEFGKVIGVVINFVVDKNKIAPPFREGSFRILFDYGIDDTGTNIEFLKENQEEKGWYNICGKKIQSLNDAIEYTEDENLENDLVQEVYKRWKEIYAVVERKKRVR